MQTGTKKTPDRFQNYFCPAAANDIVHHAYAWIVKEANMQPKFLYCRAIDDPANDRGWNIIAEVWERDVLGGWGISSSTLHPEFEDTSDGYVLAESMPGTAASLPYQVFREVVNEHDTNYLIALAIAIDALPKDSTYDKASETIRANADIDIAERRKSVLPDQAGLHPEDGDEILSLTIVDANGRLLFDEKFKPKHKKEWPEAQTVNHISPDDVEHLTTIDAYMEQICRILDRIADEIVGYNVAFDIGFLKAAGATINPNAVIIDTMQEFMDAFGNSNTGHRYQPLSMAAERLGYNWTSAPHGSLPDTLACLAAQKCVDDHNWCVENLELTEDAIMNAKPIENGSDGLPKDCWDLNPGGRPFAVTEPILHRLQSSAKLCARAGTTTQFTRMTVNQWFDKAERSQRSPLGRSVDIGRAASALNSQHEHAEVPQDLTK